MARLSNICVKQSEINVKILQFSFRVSQSKWKAFGLSSRKEDSNKQWIKKISYNINCCCQTFVEPAAVSVLQTGFL